MLSKHMTLTRAGARQQEETGETGREGKGSCKKDFPRGNGVQRKQNKGKPERRCERTAQMMLVVPEVTVPKLSLIPVWSSSEYRERKLTQLVARGWLGSRLKLPHCSRALLPKYEQNTPLDPVSKPTRATVMTSSAPLLWHENH